MQHIPGDNITGLLLTICLATLSCLMNFFHFIGEADSYIIVPLMHVLQALAAVMAIVVALGTFNPEFKHRVVVFLKKVFRLK